MLTAFELIKAVVDPMCERRFGRIVNITSGSVNADVRAGALECARAALTGFAPGLHVRSRSIMSPSTGCFPVSSTRNRIESLITNTANAEGRSREDVRATFEARNPTRRLGNRAGLPAPGCAVRRPAI